MASNQSSQNAVILLCFAHLTLENFLIDGAIGPQHPNHLDFPRLTLSYTAGISLKLHIGISPHFCLINDRSALWVEAYSTSAASDQ